MGVAAPRALLGVWGSTPLKSSVAGPSLLDNCHLETAAQCALFYRLFDYTCIR